MKRIMKVFVFLLCVGLVVPAIAKSPASAMKEARKLTQSAKILGQDSADQALAALYQRLFQLQDLRREAELNIESVEFLIDDLALAYKKTDRYVDKELLKEIAVDPEHRRYPNITESSKLKIVQEVRVHLRSQEVSRLSIGKIDRDIDLVEKMIERHLARPHSGSAS